MCAAISAAARSPSRASIAAAIARCSATSVALPLRARRARGEQPAADLDDPHAPRAPPASSRLPVAGASARWKSRLASCAAIRVDAASSRRDRRARAAPGPHRSGAPRRAARSPARPASGPRAGAGRRRCPGSRRGSRGWAGTRRAPRRSAGAAPRGPACARCRAARRARPARAARPGGISPSSRSSPGSARRRGRPRSPLGCGRLRRALPWIRAGVLHESIRMDTFDAWGRGATVGRGDGCRVCVAWRYDGDVGDGERVSGEAMERALAGGRPCGSSTTARPRGAGGDGGRDRARGRRRGSPRPTRATSRPPSRRRSSPST